MQTLLITYMSSYYNYNANVRRKITNGLVWTLSGGWNQTGLTQQPHTDNSGQSYGTGLSWRNWIGASASWAKTSGYGLVYANGVVPTPLPPIIPPDLLVTYSAQGYAFSLSSNPTRHLSMSATFSHAASNNVNAGVANWTSNQQFSSQVRYEFRKMTFNGGYARLMQSVSSSGVPAADVSSFFVGVSRWFNFF